MNNSAELRVTASDEYDGTSMVTVRVQSGPFAGEGTACFGNTQLINFSEALDTLALKFEGEPEVSGGYFTIEGQLKEKLVGLRFFTANRRGYIGVQVDAATVPAGNETLQVPQLVRVAFSVESGQVQTFARHFADCIRNERREAILVGSHGAT